jgi:hypothetical protein
MSPRALIPAWSVPIDRQQRDWKGVGPATALVLGTGASRKRIYPDWQVPGGENRLTSSPIACIKEPPTVLPIGEVPRQRRD